MIRRHHRFVRPRTLDEATALLAGADGRGRVLGGGSVLVPALSDGSDDPELVLDMARLGLDEVHQADDSVTIGAGTTYAALEASEVVRTRVPLLAAMVREVTGGPGLWNLATLGGSACYANPASDGPGCLVALDARFRLVSAAGSRLVAANAFFRGAFETDRRAEEILTEVVVPAPPLPGWSAYLKLKHMTGSWPIVTASCLIVEHAPGEARIRLCLGGAAPSPLVMEWPRPDPLDADRVSTLARDAAQAIGTEWTDDLAGPGYRRVVAGTMAARALRAVEGLAG